MANGGRVGIPPDSKVKSELGRRDGMIRTTKAGEQSRESTPSRSWSEVVKAETQGGAMKTPIEKKSEYRLLKNDTP